MSASSLNLESAFPCKLAVRCR
ncbi:hypothetical protein CEXT_224231, partial [Caerostris extrusa]